MFKYIAGLAVAGLSVAILPALNAEPCATAESPCVTACSDTTTKKIENVTLTKLDTSEMTFVVKSCCGVESSFTMNSNTKITINGRDATIADLRTGDRLSVTYSGERQVTRVAVVRA